MSIERVIATSLVPAPAQRQRGETAPLQAGRTGLAPSGVDPRAEPPVTRWQLEAGGETARQLKPGEVVQVRVVSTVPQLEVELLPVQADGALQAEAGLHAMRLDQAGLRQVHWYMPDAQSLAAVWRVLLRAHARQQGAPSAPPSAAGSGAGRTEPAEERATPSPLAAPRDYALAQEAAASRWVFPVFAWGGLFVTLHLRLREEQRRREPGARREPTDTVLEVDLVLPELGRVRLRLQWLAPGLVLSLAPALAASLPPLRAIWPALEAALARGPWAVAACRLEAQLPALGDVPGPGERPAVSPALLGVAAEAVAFLARRWPAQPEPPRAIESGPISPRSPRS